MPAPSTVPSPLPGGNSSTTTVALPTITPTIQQPLHQKDTTWTKLFVGGLPYHTTDKSLREHFECYGDIEEAVVITDRSTGKSRGYGFVIMATKETAERACKEPNPIIDGRKANVNLAILGAKPRGNVTCTGLPLTALRPGYPAIIPSQYGAAPAQGLPPAAANTAYLQQLYAAASPYGLTTPGGFLALNGMAAPTGNPLLDMYGQYMAAASYPAGAVPVTAASISPPLDTSQQPAMAGGYAHLPAGYTYAPITAQQLQTAGLGAAAAAGMTMSSAAGLPSPYAAAAGPTTATVSAGPQPADARLQ